MPTLAPDLHRRLQGLRALVGNTPLLAIACKYRGRRRVIYAKAEHLNLTGSIKDRMALHILRQAYRRGALEPGDLIIEATSGNTGIAFAALGRAMGHPVAIFMPDWMSEERINLIRFFGADIHLVSAAEGGFLGSIRRAEELAEARGHAFLPRQFSNEDNCGAHAATTGPEILWQLAQQGLKPDAIVAGVGTGGTIMGTGRFMRERVPGITIHPLEPAGSPTLSTGHKVGKHRIQGISDEFIPAIVDLAYLDAIVAVDDGDAILMAQRLARELGLAVGISAGANFLGALQLQERLGADAVVVTFFCDDNKKYLSTDLVREEPVLPSHQTPGVTLLGFEAFARPCESCGDWELPAP
ncbi:MAG: PLP-dependent cysteine synthase family protein [Gemmatimonadota bacterium]